MDHSHAINLIIEKFAEYNKPLYVGIIDYEKAFQCIEIQAVLEALRRQGVPDVYVQTISTICKDCTATLLVHEKSRKIPIKRNKTRRYNIPKLYLQYPQFHQKGEAINAIAMSDMIYELRLAALRAIRIVVDVGMRVCLAMTRLTRRE